MGFEREVDGHIGATTRIITVAKKAIPSARAMSLRRFFSIATFPSRPVEEESSSDVTRSMIAVTASQSPMSETDSGNLSWSFMFF